MTAPVRPRAVMLPLVGAFLLLLPGLAPAQPPEKEANSTAVAVAKEWRYPGVITVDLGLSPVKSEAFCLERYAVNAEFADVWDHYAAKSSSTARFKFKDKVVQAVMGELDGADKGHFMVLDVSRGQEAHFGQNTEKRTVHVEIRRSGEKQTEICVLVGVR